MAEFASFILNRQSTPITSNSNSYKKNNSKPYLNSDTISSKTENSNVDLSWLPNYNNDDRFANGDHDISSSSSCHHQNEQNDNFDDSWLPTNYINIETKRKTSSSVPILNNKPNHHCSHKTENGNLDDSSWLPSTTNVKNNETKNKGLQNYTKKNNSTKTTSKSTNSNRSSLPCSQIVKNDDKKKESIHRKSGNNHDYWERARETTFTTASSTAEIIQHNAKVLHNKKTDSSRSQGRVSPCVSESSVETDSLGGVSTLLRRWKDVETKTFSKKEKSSSSSINNNNNNNHSIRRPSKYFTGGSDESFLGSESCKSGPSRSLSCNIPSSSSGTNDMKPFDVEKEKIRIMGMSIINKLPKEEEEWAARNSTTSESCGKEHKCVSPVLGKTRLIRGRQAYLGFLSLTELDKRRELESLTHKRVVSKFPHHGRIQAMLRVRLLRLGAEPKIEARSHKRSVSKTMKTIWDKFSTGVKHGATPSRKTNENGEDTRSHASLECSVGCSAVEDLEMTITTATSSTIATATTTTATNNQEPETSSTSCNDQLTQETKDHQQNAELTMDVINSSSHSIQSREDTHSEIVLPEIQDYHEKPRSESEISNPNGVQEKGYDDSIQLQSDMDLENCHNWISEYSQSQSEWDEDEFYYSNDWISEISRPQSYWEYMRQKRYQEMHHLFSYNRDLNELLERRSVSFFLSSNHRNKLDQLMVSRAQGSSNKQEIRVRELTKEEEEDDDSRQGSENIDFINDQTTCSSTPAQPRSWSHQNPIYDSYQTPSQSPIPSSLWQNNAPQTSSIEMELIYDLRRYVEQLHHEIMELRKSITTIKIEQSSQKKTCQPINTKRHCCVCDAVQADSFLYRCGHMCTCYDCGLELQCASGKCPICEASIVDVVRAYTYNK